MVVSLLYLKDDAFRSSRQNTFQNSPEIVHGGVLFP